MNQPIAPEPKGWPGHWREGGRWLALNPYKQLRRPVIRPDGAAFTRLNTMTNNTHEGWSATIVNGVAFLTGNAIIAASTNAVIDAGKHDAAHAALLWALAVGLASGAVAFGRALSRGRRGSATLILLFTLFCEVAGVILSGDRIVAEREQSQVAARAANERHDYAAKEHAKAIDAKTSADRAAISEAAKSGCKENCRKLLDAQVENAKGDLNRARKLVEANPKSTVSGSPLADRLGIPAWTVDLAVAVLLSLGANGLAAALIAFAAHGPRTVRPVTPVAANDAEPMDSSANRSPNRSGKPNSSRRTIRAKTKAEAESAIGSLLAANRPIPSQKTLVTEWGVAKSTVSEWMKDWDARGITKREQIGKCKMVRAA